MTEAKITPSPGLYRELSEPFDSPEEANESLEKFYEAVRAARAEHGIADFYLVTQVGVVYSSGEGVAHSSFALGNQSNRLALAAYAYGREKKFHEELIAAVIASARETE